MISDLPAPGDAVALPLVSRTVAIEPSDLPRDLIDLVPASGGMAWVRRGDGLVAWGETARIRRDGPDRLRDAEAAWRELAARAVVRDEVRLPGTGPLAFGAFAFAESSRAGGVLVVPRVVVGRRGDAAWMTTIDVGALAPGPAGLTPQPPPHAPGPVTYADGALDAQGWQRAVGHAVAEIRSGRLEKVVLAREVHATTTRPLDPRWVLHRLAAEYGACWTFAVDGMLGATPELLLRSEKGLVTSRVLAGTIRRTGDDDADLAHAAVLAHSSKDLEEHEYAVASLADSLAPFCSSTNVPETPFVLHLPNVLHLATDVTGVLTHEGLASGVLGPPPSSLAIAAALHPTAAVAGTPTAQACELIARIEGIDRGRYAGPVGWIGSDGDGEWAIALRSAELGPDPNRLRLFAGCGIVAASDPAAELAESEAKLEPMRYALAE